MEEDLPPPPPPLTRAQPTRPIGETPKIRSGYSCQFKENQATASGGHAYVIMLRRNERVFEIKIDANLTRAEEIATIIARKMYDLTSTKDDLKLSVDRIKREIKNSGGIPDDLDRTAIQITKISPKPRNISHPLQVLKIIYFGIENKINNDNEMHEWFLLLEYGLKIMPENQRSTLISSFLKQTPDMQQQFLMLAQRHIENWNTSALCSLLKPAQDCKSTLNDICDHLRNKKFDIDTEGLLFNKLNYELKQLHQDNWIELTKMLSELPPEQIATFEKLTLQHVGKSLLHKLISSDDVESSVESAGPEESLAFENFYYDSTNPSMSALGPSKNIHPHVHEKTSTAGASESARTASAVTAQLHPHPKAPPPSSAAPTGSSSAPASSPVPASSPATGKPKGLASPKIPWYKKFASRFK